jgi:hypothetical protein
MQIERPGRVWLVQAAYYAITGIWGLIHIPSFEWITGPKTDRWLVKTVSALVIAIGGAIGYAGASSRVTRETAVLAIGSATSLAAIDTWYAGKRRISPVYFLDAVANVVLIMGWVRVLRRDRS